MDAEEIKDKIKNDDRYTIGALLTLYQYQTADEQMMKATAYQNDLGFNAVDAGILSDICKFYIDKGWLSGKQIQLIRTKLMKYCNQLASVGLEPVDFEKKEKKKKRSRKIKRASIETESTIKVEFTFDQDLLQEVKVIHGRRFIVDEKYWTVPMTLTNVEKLMNLGFNLDPDLKAWYDDQTKGITSDIRVPGLDDVLRPFQKEAVSFIEAKNGRVLIADEMGLGKTLESIAWLQLHGSELFPVLIICPATLKLNWMKEINKWTDVGKHTMILSGTTPYPITKPIAIINYDIIYNWADYIVKNMPPQLVIADEVHYCKSRGWGFKTQNGVRQKVLITQRSAGTERVAKKAKYFIGLTGTPILNRPKEIFNPLKMINSKLFPNFKSFAYRYCDPKFNGFATAFNGASNTVELNQILTKEVMLRRKKEDVLKELPPKVRSLVPLEIDNLDEYTRAEDDFMKYIKSIDPEKARRAKNAEVLTKINTLRRLSVSGKLRDSIKWIDDFIENDKLVVFVHHHETMDEIMKKFEKYAVKVDGRVSAKKRNEAVERFQNDERTRLFVGQIDAAGVGLTLTAASNVAFIEYPWQPGAYVQAEDRCHRIGQKDNVTVWNLIASNTIEESMVNLLENKAKTISEVVDGDFTEEAGIFNDLLKKLKGE